MTELYEWMDSKGIPLAKVVNKLRGQYSEGSIIYASEKVFELEPDIKPIHLFWKIKHILETRPHPDYYHRVARLEKALIKMNQIPWYVTFFSGANAIGVW